MRVDIPKDAYTGDVVDRSFLTDLIDAIGKEDYCALMESFEADAESLLGALEESAHNGDTTGMKATAHRLAGLLSQFGVIEVVSVAERIREARSFDDTLEHVTTMARLCRASTAVVLMRSDCDAAP